MSIHLLPNKPRHELLTKLEGITEIPLMILSLIMIPLLVGPFLWDLPENIERRYFLLDSAIWIIFLVDMSAKIWLSSSRIQYIKAHRLELIAVLVPWFRPLRIIRLVVFTMKGYRGLTRAGKPDFLLVYAVALVSISSTLVTTFENNYESKLDSFGDVLWWSIVTITTVGYGEMVPQSSMGRAVAVVLMLGGIGLFGAITANLASFFTKNDDSNTSQTEQLTKEIQELRAEIRRIPKP